MIANLVVFVYWVLASFSGERLASQLAMRNFEPTMKFPFSISSFQEEVTQSEAGDDAGLCFLLANAAKM